MAPHPRAGLWVGWVLALAVLATSTASGEELRSLRTRALRADVEAVRGKARVGEVLALRLFEDAGFEAVADRVSESEENGLVWSGRLRDVENGWTVLVVSDDEVMAGVVSTPDRVYRIRYTGGGMHTIDELDPAALDLPANDAVIPEGPFAVRARPRPLPSPATEDDPAILDVLWVYTKEASTRLVGEGYTGQRTAKKAIKAGVQLAVAVANQCLVNSNVPAEYRIVGLKKITYTPLGDTGADLMRFRLPADGHADKVLKLREKFGADLVAAVLEEVTPGAAGLGYQLPPTSPFSADYAFSVIHYTYLWFSTFAHEAGHNIGLAHDLENDAVGPQWRAFPYSLGYRDPAAGFASVMSYLTGCATCRYKIPHYSSPDVRWQGAPSGSTSNRFQPGCGNGTTTGPKCGPKTGTPDADNAQSLADTVALFAQHRACKVKCAP